MQIAWEDVFQRWTFNHSLHAFQNSLSQTSDLFLRDTEGLLGDAPAICL